MIRNRDSQDGREAGVANFGLRASEGVELDELLAQAAREVADSLAVSYVKILEYLPDEHALLVRNGVGWCEGVIGEARVGADLGSPAGYALQTGLPVISNELHKEERFRLPQLLAEHGVKSAVNVIIRNQGNVFGVLEADSRDPRSFTDEDVRFLQGYANILSFAIEQHRLMKENQELVARQETLLRELQHRTKNNNQQLLSMIRLQLASVSNVEARDNLERIAHRVRALTSVGEHFAHQAKPDLVDLGQYLMALISSLFGFYREQVADVRLETQMAQVEITTEAAQSVGLILNEFLTNSFKYAFADGGGKLCATLDHVDHRACLMLSDSGPGIPKDAKDGLGRRLIDVLVRQLEGTARWDGADGTRLELEFPIRQPAAR